MSTKFLCLMLFALSFYLGLSFNSHTQVIGNDGLTSDNAITAYPYSLIKAHLTIQSDNSIAKAVQIGETIYESDGEGVTSHFVDMVFDKNNGTVAPISYVGNISPQESHWHLEVTPQATPYKMVSNPKGGAFILDPDTSDVWYIDTKGNYVKGIPEK